MKTTFQRFLWASCIAIIGLAGCDTQENTIYTPDNLKSDADPKVATIESVEKPAFAGIDVLTITGSNFSTDLSKTVVYFTFYLPDVDEAGNIKLSGGKPVRGKVKDTIRGTILEATATQLKVRPPARPAFDPADPKTRPVDDADVRVTVLGAENFSTAVKVDLPPSFEPISVINQKLEDIYALTTDKDNNAYMFIISDNAPAGFFKVTPAGVRSTFVPASAIGTLLWSDLYYNATESYLYGVRNQRAVFRFKQSGTQETYAVIANTSVKLATITTDGKGNLWTGGNNTAIYRIAPDKTVKEYAFTADIRAIRTTATHLYAVAKQGTTWGIWRFPINATNDLGAAEQWVTFPNFGTTDEAYSLALATNGDLLVGTNRDPDPILVVKSDKTISALYPTIFTGAVRGLAWVADPTLLVGQGILGTYKANLLKVNTRRNGVRL